MSTKKFNVSLTYTLSICAVRETPMSLPKIDTCRWSALAKEQCTQKSCQIRSDQYGEWIGVHCSWLTGTNERIQHKWARKHLQQQKKKGNNCPVSNGNQAVLSFGSWIKSWGHQGADWHSTFAQSKLDMWQVHKSTQSSCWIKITYLSSPFNASTSTQE